MLWAAGPGPLVKASGLNMASAQHGFQRTQLLKNLAAKVSLPNGTWDLTVTEENNPVPATDTTYWCRVVKLPNPLVKKHHIVKASVSWYIIEYLQH